MHMCKASNAPPGMCCLLLAVMLTSCARPLGTSSELLDRLVSHAERNGTGVYDLMEPGETLDSVEVDRIFRDGFTLVTTHGDLLTCGTHVLGTSDGIVIVSRS